MSKHLEITGVVSPPGLQLNVAPRLEAHELVKDEKLFSLYVQAIKSKEDLADSYFQIAGIHGLPYVRWDGAGPEQPAAAPAGYCQHLTTLFSTWHRLYCALYEQTINRHATDIAAEYKVDPEEWKMAAAKPAFLIGTGPDVGRQFENTRRDVAELFEVKDWFHLEAIHGILHGRIGGRGHMSYIPYAAFDPIFWLHHCNVDRTFALWQAINHKQWITPLTKDSDRTWVTDFNTLVNENTRTARAASGIRPNAVTGQSFGALITIFMVSKRPTLQLSARPLVNGLTPPAAAPAFAAPQANMIAATANSLMSGAAAGVAALTGAAGSTSSAPAINRVPESMDWTVRIRCKQSDLLEITYILIYLGDIPDNEELCLTDEHLVGSYDPFVNPYPKGCRNCVERVDVMDVAAVEEYLKENLKWAIRKVGFPGLPVMDSRLIIRSQNTGGYGRVEV
ncbi:hypothetical protein FRC04_001924 [Tulasnella sp. 424]|nr:hypothetical protein FRC04_001924 [Tulasnella sp. 424]